ncbi:DUF6734 family protein [Ulvibacterium sp.]|uniref:DUF6734 family protein n=1 Tax=Ulvibacterium sp. TaxID=2665914 RepID=UPI002629C01C|nr:DUF6734 family protein [Ulvibacterium sp.]
MKIIHSYWSKPAQATFNKKPTEKLNGGWRHPKYQYMSWALSCLSFKKYYDEIELVTDIAGEELLINQLKLPYTSVKVELDKLNNYSKKLWAIGKLFAFGLQDKPFIHVDNDVFIWEQFSKRIENAPLLAQHMDIDEGHYTFAMQHLKDNGIKIPLILRQDFKKHKRYNVSNAGIIGGNDIEFFKKFSNQAFEFIDSNIEYVNGNIIGATYAIVYEQYLFSAMARSENIRIEHFIEDLRTENMGLSNFIQKYEKRKYVHLIAGAKSYFESCRELEQQLILDYPEYHTRIISLF